MFPHCACDRIDGQQQFPRESLRLRMPSRPIRRPLLEATQALESMMIYAR